MTLTEIRALPQELVEAWEKHRGTHGGGWFEFEKFVDGSIGERPAVVSNDHDPQEAGYAYWLARRGGK